jgi:hypothetical protein
VDGRAIEGLMGRLVMVDEIEKDRSRYQGKATLGSLTIKVESFTISVEDQRGITKRFRISNWESRHIHPKQGTTHNHSLQHHCDPISLLVINF